MCMDCGCHEYGDCHGDIRHVTTLNIDGAAHASGLTLGQTTRNIREGLDYMDANLTATDPQDKVEKSFEKFVLSITDVGKETEVVRGTLLKSNEEDHFLLMVAYSPHRMPLRGKDKRIDLASPRVLEKACWRFMAKGAKTGMWHEEGHGEEAVCVENYVYRNPVAWDVHGDGSLLVKEGDWIVAFILGDSAWDLYKSGRIGGVSMQGAAGRKAASAESLARVRSNA